MFPLPANENVRLAALSVIDVEACRSDAMDALTNLARSIFTVPVAVVSLIDTDTLHVVAPSAAHQRSAPRGAVPCAQTILGTGPMIVPDLAQDSRFAGLPCVTDQPNFRFYAGVPLARDAGVNLGTFCLFDSTPRSFGLAQRDQLIDIGRAASGLLRLEGATRALLSTGEQLRRAAATDPLTGCLNRIGMREEVGDTFEGASDAARGAAAIYIDVDHFKEINDRFGHPAGDAVLREAASRIRSSIRGDDVIGRIGGDEFCVVLRGVKGVAELEAVAKRIVGSFDEPIIVNGQPIPCTVSVGGALAPLHATTREGIAKQADVALYAAKERGRNGYAIAA